MGLRQRATEDREVLAVHGDRPIGDPSVARHDAVTEEALLPDAELGGPMRDECIELDEASGVEEQVEPLARGQLAALVLLFDALFAAAQHRLGTHAAQPFGPFVDRHGPPCLCAKTSPF